MPKWKIILPVLIVVVVGLVAYMQMTTKEEAGPPAPADEAAVGLDDEMDVTGEEDVDVQVDALIDSLVAEAATEEAEADDGSGVVSALEEGGDESELFTVETYE